MYTQLLLKKCAVRKSLSIFMAYIADVVGIAPGLEQLRDIRRQSVLLMDLLQTSLVEQLYRERTMRTNVTGVVKTIFSKVLLGK